MRISTRATSAFAARRGVRARDARQRHNCPTRFEIAIKLERATRANKCGAPMLSVAEFSRVRARVWSLLLARGTSSSGPRGPLELEMSILCCLKPGEARTRASEPAREPECNALIVHPLFVSDLTREPETFCPMDWLPDEVISNVLVHLVRPTPALFLDH